MLATIKTAAVSGLESVPIDVEVDVAKQSFPAFTVVGLPDKAIDESRERVRSALKNSGAEFPQHRITVNLAPADLPKNGPSFDLPIALGLLVSSEQIACNVSTSWFAGELSLDGSLRHINGVLPMAKLARDLGAEQIFVPVTNAAEAALIDGLTVFGIESLQQLVLHLTQTAPLQPVASVQLDEIETLELDVPDMADILGQEQAKRALEIAAAGGHNLLMQGLPGSGKTLLARSFAGIMPPLTFDEALEVSTIYSVAGMLGKEPMLRSRPFRSPHHTTSNIGLIGGGVNPRPGEVSLAHRGVLFLDEFAEFPRAVLEALRQPVEDGTVTVSRAKASYTFPARFQLLAAQNPCPCGHFGDPRRSCVCTQRQIQAYQKRVSGPLLDRIDLFVNVPRVEEQHFQHLGSSSSESSAGIRARVIAARQRQQHRLYTTGIHHNAAMSGKQVKQFCQLDIAGQQLMQLATAKFQLSARGYMRVLKVARTIADLGNSEEILSEHVSEALQYRVSMS